MQPRDPDPQVTRQGLGCSIFLGILLIILGIIAIAEPVFAAIVTNLFFGWIFILGGIVQLIYAFQSRGAGSIALKVVLAVLAIAAGIFLIANPLAGILSLSLFIGAYFFVDGAFRVVMAFQLKPAARWGWVLANGILMIILGILIWSRWPFDAPWVVGILVGIGLLFNGLATLMLSIAARNAAQPLE